MHGVCAMGKFPMVIWCCVRQKIPLMSVVVPYHWMNLVDDCAMQQRLGYCNANTQPVADLFATADDALFKRMLANQHHVLQLLLPDQSSHNSGVARNL